MSLENQANTENNQTDIQWEALNFEGKEFVTLLDDGKTVVLKQTSVCPERILAELKQDNASITLNALSEKFQEVKSKMDEFEHEFAATEESEHPKLLGKAQRLKDYFLQANAIGDYVPVILNVEDKISKIEQQVKSFIAQKEAIVAESAALAASTEWKSTSDKFREVVQKWKEIPFVPKEISDKLWEKFEQSRNAFFEAKRAYQESLESGFMQNLDLKIELCEQAEALKDSTQWKETNLAYQDLMAKWKVIGRVASPEKNEELWNRFNAARNYFFEKKNENFEQLKSEQEQNLKLKEAIIEKAEALKESTEWKETSQKYTELMDEWKSIGRVPFEKADEVWTNFIAVKDYFFNRKKQFNEEYKINLEDNYTKKKLLLDRAEKIKDSQTWRDTTFEMNDLLAEWKKIGPIPREYGDELWEQFIAARHFFFEKKDKDRESRKSHFTQQLNTRIEQSHDFLKKLKEELEDDEDKLKDFNQTLSETGEDSKDEEIKQQLVRLIGQIEKRIPTKMAKIEEVLNQITELEGKREEIDNRKE